MATVGASKVVPNKNDWHVFAVVLMIITAISTLAGWGFGAITGLIVFALYGWVCLYERQTVINNITRELAGLIAVTFAEIVVLVGAAAVTAIIWLLSLIPQYFLDWGTLPFGQTLFFVWLILSVILWLLDRFFPDPSITPEFT